MTEEVEFEWDPAKDPANQRKHNVPFLKAIDVFKDPRQLERLDDSEDYGEDRWIGLGCVEQMILTVVFTLRGQRIRLISARRANRDEQRVYWAGYISS
jgi:uncharacterized protein